MDDALKTRSIKNI